MGHIDTIHLHITVNDFHKKYAQSNDFFWLHINLRSINKYFEKLEELLVGYSKIF